MTQIYLIRHAEAEGNLYRRMHGLFDGEVTPRGLRQIAALRQRFDGVRLDAVYASPLKRAYRTAEGLCVGRAIEPIPLPGLEEVHMGVWEDLPFGACEQQSSEQYKNFTGMNAAFSVPGGETFREAQARITEALLRIAAEQEGRTVAVASHAMALRTALCWAHGWGLERLPEVRRMENTAVSLLTLEDGVPSVCYEQDDSHLPEELSPMRQHGSRAEGAFADARLWFRNWEPEGERNLYFQFRQELWRRVHGTEPFDGESFYRVALHASHYEKSSVRVVMHKNRIAGMLQLDLERDAAQGVGFIPLCYLCPPYRGQGLGVQLLGEAVSICRPLGRSRLRLRCSPVNEVAKRFYKANGFICIGPALDSRVPLDLLEKQI